MSLLYMSIGSHFSLTKQKEKGIPLWQGMEWKQKKHKNTMIQLFCI